MKNHLFIGLGGQGGRSIAELKKVFESRAGDAESLRSKGHSWDWLYIDSSKDVTNVRAHWVHFGQSLRLDPASFLYLKDDSHSFTAPEIALKPDVAPWIGEVRVLERFLQGVQGIQGANQRRRFGRLLFANKADNIRLAVCDAKIAPLLARANQCAIHIFASLAGGTGSGGIVDLVTMLRTEYPNASVDDGFPIFLYVYVTSDDFDEAEVGYFHQNQYAALRDLNALACGRLHTTMLGLRRGGQKFSGQEPITQILLSTSLSNRNQRITLPMQHQILAEAAFERIFAYGNGDLEEAMQKPLTGEDRLGAFPGEPASGLLRSFRFGSLGMRRWEIPTDTIHDLLATELYASCFSELLYQNWNQSSGFLAEKMPSHQSGQAGFIELINRAIQGIMVQNVELPSLVQAMTEDFGQAHSGLKSEGFRELDLADYEQRLRQRYESNLSGAGVDTIFASIARERSNRVRGVVTYLQESIMASWTSNQGPLGLAYLPDALLEIQQGIKDRLTANNATDGTRNDQLLRRMAARGNEWRKLTFLSRPFKQAQLAEANKADLINLLTSDLRNRAVIADQELLNELVTEIGKLDNAYRQCVAKIQAWHRAKLERSSSLQHDLSSLNEDNEANKCELSKQTMELYLREQRIQANHLRNATKQMLSVAILPALGERSLDQLGKLSEAVETQLWERADETLYATASQLHAAIVEGGNVEPLLTLQLLDVLQARHRSDPAAFEQEMQRFIESATCSARVDSSQLQPKELRGDPNMPRMPRTALVMGLPRSHPFSPDLKRMVEPLMPAGENTVRGFYYHEDPTQIRLLFVASFMAARFAAVIKQLATKYDAALAGNSAGDTAYFTNIDNGGQEGKRPHLLLPDPSAYRSLMWAALWLGARIPVVGEKDALIQETSDRVTLLLRTEQGLNPELLGTSIQQLVEGADARKISLVADAVATALMDLPSDKKDELRTKVKAEESLIAAKHGSGSADYADWVNKRTKLYELLDQ